LGHILSGPVVGFALRWEGQRNGVLWISGDTVLYDGVREVADRLDGLAWHSSMASAAVMV
jgi:hypothetical protein